MKLMILTVTLILGTWYMYVIAGGPRTVIKSNDHSFRVRMLK